MRPRAMRILLLLCLLAFAISPSLTYCAERPNVILVMADDQGWGQTGYYNHPILKTPNLDAMAEAGLRLDRFYAGGPVCSPTRATVLTGRTHDRTGVLSHGYALHLQERTLSQAMQKAGYATGHFGKWHLNGIRGPGVPILSSDDYHPGRFGFGEWLSVTNFFDMNPVLSRRGELEEHTGDSSEVVVDQALNFIAEQQKKDQPFFTIIWFGSPHSPFKASEQDQIRGENTTSANHHGEIVAMDRSLGTLREGLKQMGLSKNTLVWYCSDNGGLPNVGHDSVGGLRGNKGSVWEGGVRVPCIIEWPNGIKPRISATPACTMDIFPTLVDLLDLPADSMLDLIDGMSIQPLFQGEVASRTKPIPIHYGNKAALIDNNLKIVTEKVGSGEYLLFDLAADKTESKDLFSSRTEDADRMRKALDAMCESISQSKQGADYAEGVVTKEGPHGRFWNEMPEYEPYFDNWAQRPEYKSWIKRKPAAK